MGVGLTSLYLATSSTIDAYVCKTEPSELYFPYGLDHAMIACYLELYEGEVEHINGSTHPCTDTHAGLLLEVEYMVACLVHIWVGMHVHCMMP